MVAIITIRAATHTVLIIRGVIIGIRDGIAYVGIATFVIEMAVVTDTAIVVGINICKMRLGLA